jgi:hypothetical protein
MDVGLFGVKREVFESASLSEQMNCVMDVPGLIYERVVSVSAKNRGFHDFSKPDFPRVFESKWWKMKGLHDELKPGDTRTTGRIITRFGEK